VKLFLLDNYDSFTYNLVQYLGELGADVMVRRNDEVTPDEVAGMAPSAVVLSPGPGRPADAGILRELIRSLEGRTPILGVCLGQQAIAEVYGGRIDYAPELMHGKTSYVNHDGSDLFVDVESPFVATRYHSLVVDPLTFPPALKRIAWTDDGVIMGLRHLHLPVWGVQFHPESIMTPAGKTILRNFLGKLRS
jgi:anthranilate synthase component 2